MTEPRDVTYLVPADVLAEVNAAVTVLDTYGPAVTEALRQLDRATTVTWKAVSLVEVTDEEWQLVNRAIGIDRGWDAVYRLVSSLDLPGPRANNIARTARKRAVWWAGMSPVAHTGDGWLSCGR
jgi:hypothetical protein